MNGQFRMSRLQVYNWGTFTGLQEIPIAERGFLFVGRSGAGKTTLLDAFSTLLVPPKWVDFNAAAREGEPGTRGRDRDRSLLTYVRGAWALQEDDSSGEVATQFLRTGTTWSGLALTYRSDDRTVALAQIFWIKGKSTKREDLHRLYLIFERPFDLREAENFSLDVRKLKQSLPDAWAKEDFAPYSDRFRRLLGIDNELALKLLHKTQAAKNLGDLNNFLRDFMLDKPDTFEAADRLAAEFAELNAAHQAVITARRQIQTLVPARDNHALLVEQWRRERDLKEVRAGVDVYKDTCVAERLRERLLEISVEIGTRKAERDAARQQFENDDAVLEDLRRRHLQSGGQRIEDLEREKQRMEDLRAQRLDKRSLAQTALQKLQWPMPQNPREFAETAASARARMEEWTQWNENAREKHHEYSTKLEAAKRDFAAATEEVEALQRQPSNVPAKFLKMRAGLCEALGLSPDALPFAAEWMEVLPRESEWRGAIERLLGGFAVSILVEDKYYTSVSECVNRTSLHGRLFYNKVSRTEPPVLSRLQPNSLFHKLQVKKGAFTDWLNAALVERFDYACVDSMHAFRNTQRALTREGQVRHGKDRHEKDDRFHIEDRDRWVLGFDNRPKLALFEKKAQDAAAAINDWQQKLRDLTLTGRAGEERARSCQFVANLEWMEIDTAPALDRIAQIDRELAELRKGNTTLQELGGQIDKQKKQRERSQNAMVKAAANLQEAEKDNAKSEARFTALTESLRDRPITPLQQRELPQYFDRAGTIMPDNADMLARRVERELGEEQEAVIKACARLTRAIEECFAKFNSEWGMDSDGLDPVLASSPEYFAKLNRLENDRLPDYEHRFFELLRNQSYQNLAALSARINHARKTIFDRLEVVNESLSQAAFDHGTYLEIAANDLNLEPVKQFKHEIQEALKYAWTDDRDQAEARFEVLRILVEKLKSKDREWERWRTLVLDVRQHVTFIGREYEADGKKVMVHTGGDGKSGGQRQKFATTCLAAALKYQLGGEVQGRPQYAPVILDEAFDKADNEFTTMVMKIFEEFGFQMIVATPLKSVMTLERFIGGACFVDIADRCRSGCLMIEYDEEQQRLRLPERLQREAKAALS